MEQNLRTLVFTVKQVYAICIFPEFAKMIDRSICHSDYLRWHLGGETTVSPMSSLWRLYERRGATNPYRNGFCERTAVLGITFAYFADEVRSHVRRVAELSAHLQVTDTADGIPELRQAVGAQHQQGHVGSDVVKLRRNGPEEDNTAKETAKTI